MDDQDLQGKEGTLNEDYTSTHTSPSTFVRTSSTTSEGAPMAPRLTLGIKYLRDTTWVYDVDLRRESLG